MELFIVTSNKHKVEEARAVFSEYGIEIKQIADEKIETKEMDLLETAEFNAKMYNEKYNKPVIVDDTGVFFSAFPNFPGNHPKLIFELLGYKGLLKLLDGEDRNAEFRTVVSYCDQGIVTTFSGSLKCIAASQVYDKDKDVLPYERILMLDGKPISGISRDEKNKISHRAIAFRKVADFLTQKAR
ncbi:MAG: non-canonical purine NTP pyrophosphatase [archaeon]